MVSPSSPISPSVIANRQKCKRGAFIVFEGIDRSGKSTQASMLVERLKEQNITAVQHLSFPDRTTLTGKLIDSYLRGSMDCPKQMAHLLFALNRWDKNEEIKKILKSGVSIVCDRYSFSGVAYSHGALGLPFEWCKNPEIGLAEPDLVLFLDANAEVCSTRAQFGEERYEKKNILNRVSSAFRKFENEEYWHRLDANQSIEEIHNEVWSKSTSIIKHLQETPALMRELWEEEIKY